MQVNLKKINTELKDKTPAEIIKWAISIAKRPVVTTNFRPYEVAILHAVSAVKSNIKVVWCDTGYNTPDTYRHAQKIIKSLELNVRLYIPKQTKSYRDVALGFPDVDSPKHKLFTRQVKLEPFNRAMSEHEPDLWFTNLRKGQTAFRDSIDIVSLSNSGIIKVSPFYNWSDAELDNYLAKFNLPNEFNYFDPTKVLNNRECGLHV